VRLFIDSDIFIRDLRYQRDANYHENAPFLSLIKAKHYEGVTSIFNLLEVCGILSFNLSYQNLLQLYVGFRDHYGLEILFTGDPEDIISFSISEIFAVIGKKLSFSDALIASVVEYYKGNLDAFVSWNAVHFKDRLGIKAVTPIEIVSK
jgi:predicted nucleic acid-binding protein